MAGAPGKAHLQKMKMEVNLRIINVTLLADGMLTGLRLSTAGNLSRQRSAWERGGGVWQETNFRPIYEPFSAGI